MEDIKFLEIEHKYVVKDSFDRIGFDQLVRSMGPSDTTEVDVTDTYYLVKSCPNYVYRHRLDKEIQHLSLKGLTDDPEARLEVNLDLGLHKGSQADRVEAFLAPLGPYWSGAIAKKVWVYYFPKAELVYYQASHGDKTVYCIEIEAINVQTLDEAREVIGGFEKQLNLSPQDRCLESLFHLLLLPHLPKLPSPTQTVQES